MGSLFKREFGWKFQFSGSFLGPDHHQWNNGKMFESWNLSNILHFFWIKMVYCILVLVVSGLPLKCVGFPDKTGTPIFVVIATWHPSVIPPMYVYATIITKHIINVRNAILPHTKKVRFRIHHWWWRRKKKLWISLQAKNLIHFYF